ncbi:MAG: septum formation initiator family protein [Gammaproteobacteria bacterium]|jgi:cell division protein FtsB|nr:cell division protein FtsB [Chromatiales bacterium]MDP6675573.1 septum formation initiator family protein [Gammaproteobacteria bacterium]
MKERLRKSVAFRLIVGSLLCLVLVLQARLWISNGGFSEVSRLHTQVELQTHENEQLAERNERLTAEVEDLQRGFGAVEERARSDLGLIGEDETFYVFSEERGGGEAVKTAK